MKAELIPIDGGRPIPITRDVTVVGRREYCDIQIDHPSLSKRHCVLVKTEGLLVVRDLVTTNGTRVKGQQIRWAALLPEDKIAFGSIKFKVYLGPDNVPAPSERAAGRGNAPAKQAAKTSASPSRQPAPSAATALTKPKPVARPVADDMPLILEDGVWKDIGMTGLEDEDEIIELD